MMTKPDDALQPIAPRPSLDGDRFDFIFELGG